jgi:predicted metal-binding protein
MVTKKNMKKSETETEKFRFLADKAREAGAADARIIPADMIVVEERVRLKCRSGCPSYGKYLTCPPHAPDIEDFRNYLRDYHSALLVKFKSPAYLDESIRHCILSSLFDPEAQPAQKEKAIRFIMELSENCQYIHRTMLDLEKAAFNAGNPFAVTTISGTCRLCETCNITTGICNHPTMRRFTPEALGINVVQTSADAGMPIRFPAPDNPEEIAILLID